MVLEGRIPLYESSREITFDEGFVLGKSHDDFVSEVEQSPEWDFQKVRGKITIVANKTRKRLLKNNNY
ncbi:hypothetical protein K0A97_01630 [Patescibacteria group bacterium]|nr:hypothetical protein [Patescibacteria group bacterium]